MPRHRPVYFTDENALGLGKLLCREITERGPGPWALAMSASGIRPLRDP